MAEITKIRKFSSGTAYINLPKKVLKKKGLEVGDNVSFLYPSTVCGLIITKVDDDT